MPDQPVPASQHRQRHLGGWPASAEAWVAAQGTSGDWGRREVLDAPMLELTTGARRAVDIGCGEGRFCRLLSDRGTTTIGVDPVESLIERARRLDPDGDYRLGRAEELPVVDADADLVVAYLTLIDVPDLDAAVAEMRRVLVPGGRVVIANLTSFTTATPPDGVPTQPVEVHDYLVERPIEVEFSGVRVVNWHRPLSRYVQAFLDAGFVLEHLDEPAPAEDSPRAARYRLAPWYVTMAWRRDG